MLQVIFDNGEKNETHTYPLNYGWEQTMHGFIGISSQPDGKLIAHYRIDRLICIRARTESASHTHSILDLPGNPHKANAGVV